MYKLIIVGYILSIFSGWYLYGNISMGVLSSLSLMGLALITIIFRPKIYPQIRVKEIGIFGFLLVSNLIVAVINDVPVAIWLSRSSWIIIFILMTFLIDSKDKAHQILLAVSVSRLVLILLSFVSFGFSGRATIFLNSPVYSPLVLYAPFYFMKTKKSLIAVITILIIMLTGSRLLILASIGVVAFQTLKFNLKSILYLLLVSIFLLLSTQYISVLDRFNDFGSISNDLSFLGKISEIKVMYGYFLRSPLFGVGFGHIYNNGIDIENFTYTHNLLAFLFGYSGLLGFIIIGKKFIKPIYKNNPFQLYFAMVLIFCLSTTSYSLPEMSLHFLLSTACVRT